MSEISDLENKQHHLGYSAGVMILSKEHPQKIIHSVLNPITSEERKGIVSNVVFPTGIDQRSDLGMPNRFDIYYGMADKSIGVARLDLPDILPPEGLADPPGEKV